MKQKVQQRKNYKSLIQSYRQRLQRSEKVLMDNSDRLEETVIDDIRNSNDLIERRIQELSDFDAGDDEDESDRKETTQASDDGMIINIEAINDLYAQKIQQLERLSEFINKQSKLVDELADILKRRTQQLHLLRLVDLKGGGEDDRDSDSDSDSDDEDVF